VRVELDIVKEVFASVVYEVFHRFR